jgi:hypothetical protein
VRASRENGEGSGSVSRPVQFERSFAYESTFSRIGELGTHSLVKRRPHPDDRRKNLVELTTLRAATSGNARHNESTMLALVV